MQCTSNTHECCVSVLGNGDTDTEKSIGIPVQDPKSKEHMSMSILGYKQHPDKTSQLAWVP